MQITNSSNVEQECNQKNSILSSVLFRGFHENDTGSDKIYRDGRWIQAIPTT